MSFFETIIFFIISLVIVIIITTIFSDKQTKENFSKLDKAINNLENFESSKKYVFDNAEKAFLIDEKRKKMSLIEIENENVSTRMYDFHDLLEVEILENGESLTKTSRSSQIGGALLGGLMLGGVGAIIGGLSGTQKHKHKVKNIALKLLVNDTDNPLILINVYSSPEGVDKGGSYYKAFSERAREWFSLLKIIIHNADEKDQRNNNLSIADEIEKLKKLRDDGTITDEEFTHQKNKVLN